MSDLANTYNFVEVPISGRSNSIDSWKIIPRKSNIIEDSTVPPELEITEASIPVSRAKVDVFPQQNIEPSQIKKSTTLPVVSRPPRIQSIPLMRPITGFSDPNDATSFFNPRATPRPRSEQPSIRTNVSSFVSYPVTSLPMPIVPPGIRKQVPRKVESEKVLKVTIPQTNTPTIMQLTFDDSGRIMSGDFSKKESDLLRKVGETEVNPQVVTSAIQGKSMPPTPDTSRKSGLVFPPISKIRSKLSIDTSPTTPPGPPRIPPPSVPRSGAPSVLSISDLSNFDNPVREGTTPALRFRFSRDLATTDSPEISPDGQSDMYDGVLAMLNEAISDTMEDEEDVSRHIESFRQSIREGSFKTEDANQALHRLSQTARESQRVSRAMLGVYWALSNVPRDTALEVIHNMLENPAQSKRSSVFNEESTTFGHRWSKSSTWSESDSAIGKRLNEKLAEFEDPESVIEYDSLVIPRYEKTLSGSSIDIIEYLEEEFEHNDLRAKFPRRNSTDTYISSSSFAQSDIQTADEATPATSPVWMPSARIAAAAKKVIQPKIPPTTDDAIFEHGNLMNWAVASEDPIRITDPVSTETHNIPGLSTTQDAIQKDILRGIGWSGSRTYSQNLAEESPLATQKLNTEIMQWLEPFPVKRVRIGQNDTNDEINSESPSEIAVLWKPTSPLSPTRDRQGLWNCHPALVSVKRSHGDINFNSDGNEPRLQTVSTKADGYSVSFEEQTGLWQPKVHSVHTSTWLWQSAHHNQINILPHLYKNMSNSFVAEETDKASISRTGQLWTPPLPQKPIRLTDDRGLWGRDTLTNIVIRSHREWQFVESTRYPQPLSDDLTCKPISSKGLWEKPDPKVAAQVATGMWKSKQGSKFAQHDSMMSTVSLRLSALIEHISFILDSSQSSVYSEESIVCSLLVILIAG